MLKLTDILKELGFARDEGDLVFDFGNCKLRAVKSIDNYFRDAISFFGPFFDQRDAAFIEFKLLAEVQSFELAVALLAYNLRSYRFTYSPSWLEHGLKLEDYLPGRVEMNEFKRAPKAMVESEWFKIIVNKLRAIADPSSENDMTSFEFDGKVLNINANGTVLVCPALGDPWIEKAFLKTVQLTFLPKRISRTPTLIYPFKGNLTIGNRTFELVEGIDQLRPR